MVIPRLWLSLVYQQCASKEDDIPMGIPRTPRSQQDDDTKMVILHQSKTQAVTITSQQTKGNAKITRLVQEKKKRKKRAKKREAKSKK
jgi:hypothetical protein